MCGIAGIVSFENRPVHDWELHGMCDAMTHRGPDDSGYFLSRRAGLAMRRLSIIDLASGHQPVSNEDQSVWVVLNGEIYNFQQLRHDLEICGHVFSTHSDTEVIVHLYEDCGTKCVEHLRGMFGFALWDERRQQLLLARDRLGIKPLYYAESAGRLAFASELKAILQLEDTGRDLNPRAAAHLFAFLTTPGDESIVEGVRKLEPAHVLIASAGRAPRIERYWDLNFEPDRSRPEEYFIEGVRSLLNESVRLHMVSDVPVGAFLSGGIDSSAIVAGAARLTSDRLKTFSIGFREPEYNELDYARLISRQFCTDHHELTLGSESFDSLEDLAWHLDEPFGDSSAIPTYMVSKLAAQHVKVALSGDGGDELFAGYDRYLVEQSERDRRRLPGLARTTLAAVARSLPEGFRGRNYLRHRALDGAERYLDAVTLFRLDGFLKLFTPDFAASLAAFHPVQPRAAQMRESRLHWLSTLQDADLRHYLPLDILTKVDRVSMAHSLEVRVPLLDHKLVEFAATIPPEMHLRGGAGKNLFKRAMRGIIPDAAIDRPKRGFAVPLSFWFRGNLRSQVRELLLGERTRRRGMYNTRHLETLLSRHEAGRNLDLELWTLISFELWYRTFIDGGIKRTMRARAARMGEAGRLVS
ncbi:MAG TPA: asparagine synthase (glutamine-hydrolyzing) [Bryobacteraceae bacterium]|nr:asparagine synthase (glutamine-hydrolyzing) [Bryobacteraceae bacterium]